MAKQTTRNVGGLIGESAAGNTAGRSANGARAGSSAGVECAVVFSSQHL
ncbi:hypothetical protein [Thermomonas aquatica]|nr:hypothetical protein [Thermomonas aquatica]